MITSGERKVGSAVQECNRLFMTLWLTIVAAFDIMVNIIKISSLGDHSYAAHVEDRL